MPYVSGIEAYMLAGALVVCFHVGGIQMQELLL